MIKKESLKKPKAAIYIRVSTEEQAKEGFSLSAQESSLKDYVGMMGYDLFKIYRDEGISAKDMKHRPDLQQLLKDADRKLFKAIFVYKLDRFSRSLKDLILTIERLKNLNIDFISLQDKIETASASGKLMFHIISSFAEFERDIISERTRFGMTEKAKEGGVISRAPIGYTVQGGKFVLDVNKKDGVIEIFKTFLETDKSLNSLARIYGLSVRGLTQLLRNKTYIGQIKFKNDYVGTHKPIIDKEIFDKVQEKLNRNSYNREYLKSKNLIHTLNVHLEENILEELASLLAEKHVLYTCTVVNSDNITPDDVVEINEPFKRQKYVARKILIDEGFDEKEIYFDRVFVNADTADICGINQERKIYVDCTSKNLNRLAGYINSDVEYWLIMTDNNNMRIHKFIRNS